MTTNKDQSRPQLDPKYVKEIQGRKFVLFSGLLDLAERSGIKTLSVEVNQYPDDRNGQTVICKAVAELESGKSASDIGEANADNLDERVSGFLFSMASTRAKARTLRSLLGIGMTALEELDSFENVIGDEDSDQKENTVENKELKTSSTKPITLAQIRCIKSMAKRKELSDEELHSHCQNTYSAPLDSLSRKDASSLIDHLKAA